MSIIRWSTEVPKITLGEKERKEIFTRLLNGVNIDKLWRGDAILKDKMSYKQSAPLVQIRNSKGEAEILISIGIKKPRTDYRGHKVGKIPGKACVMMSQNGTAEYTPEDFAEINLAVLEAWEVYNALAEEAA